MQCRTVSSRTKLLVFDLILSSALVLFFQLSVRASQSVAVTWDPITATNVAGLKIYSGTASHGYSNVLTVAGGTNTGTISGLVAGRTYYFAVTTFDSAGGESSYSAEASYTVPVTPATLTSPSRSGGQFSFSVVGDVGQQYVVQATTNLLDWISVQTNAAPFTFTDTNTWGFNQRYYRTFALVP